MIEYLIFVNISYEFWETLLWNVYRNALQFNVNRSRHCIQCMYTAVLKHKTVVKAFTRHVSASMYTVAAQFSGKVARFSSACVHLWSGNL